MVNVEMPSWPLAVTNFGGMAQRTLIILRRQKRVVLIKGKAVLRLQGALTLNFPRRSSICRVSKPYSCPLFGLFAICLIRGVVFTHTGVLTLLTARLAPPLDGIGGRELRQRLFQVALAANLHLRHTGSPSRLTETFYPNAVNEVNIHFIPGQYQEVSCKPLIFLTSIGKSRTKLGVICGGTP